jgi:hypothetical protein
MEDEKSFKSSKKNFSHFSLSIINRILLSLKLRLIEGLEARITAKSVYLTTVRERKRKREKKGKEKEKEKPKGQI